MKFNHLDSQDMTALANREKNKRKFVSVGNAIDFGTALVR